MRARKEIYDQSVVSAYHCFSRCVRRAFLCGTDEYSGRNYDHRKEWLEALLELAAVCHVIDLLAFAILDNHFHLLLRHRPDLRDKLTPMGIARRWLLLHPKRRDQHGRACEPTPKELRKITQDKKRVKELRQRLGNISWLMAFVKEKLARAANQEDELTGTFFEKRFEMRRLLSENAVLACSVYIDLNEIRAGVAASPETSTHSSIALRIQGLLARQDGKRGKMDLADRWLAAISQTPLPKHEQFAARQWRASDNPGLALTIQQYLELVDWSGRQLKKGKAGRIPAHLGPILERLGIETSLWMELIQSFDSLFGRIAGTPAAVVQHAARRGRRWYQGVKACRRIFDAAPPA